MSNMSKDSLSPEQVAFIEDVASLLVPLDMPPTAARLYGYTLLCGEPVSLDQISADLQLSKSSASVAARLLERHSLVRRHSERGSKRALYSFSNNYAGLLAEKSRFLGNMGDLLQDGATSVAGGDIAGRMEDMAYFYRSMQKALDEALAEYNPGSGRQH